MPTVTKRLSVLHWNTGLAGTLAYTVRSASGTHITRRTTGVTAGSVSGRRYYVDAAIDPAWPSGTEVFWDDGTDEARGPVDVREVMPGATKRFSVDWDVAAASLYYTVSGPTGTIVARTNTGVTAGGVSGKTYHVDLDVQSSWIGAEIVWDDGTDEVSEPISGGQTIDVNVTQFNGEPAITNAPGVPAVNVQYWLDNDVYVDDGGGKPVVYVEGVDDNAANTGPLADINTSLAALPTAAEIAAQVGETGGARVTITPFQAATTNPRHATRNLAAIAQHSAPTDVLTLVDGTGNGIDLTGKSLRMVIARVTDEGDELDAFDDALEGAWAYETGDGLTVGTGTGTNQVTIAHAATNNATAGVFRYWLWNTTDALLLTTGNMPVKPAVYATP